MSFSEHEITKVRETRFSLEDGKPTLWDTVYEGGHTAPEHSVRAVCLESTDGRIEIHTDPEIVASFLDD